MQNQILRNISQLIERDSKSTTYKFALLRGVIDIINDGSPYIFRDEENMKIPIGLMVEKWIIYYYPLLQHAMPIPQIHGKSKLQFEIYLKKIVSFYETKGGLSVLYNDLRTKGVPQEINNDFKELIIILYRTITTMPMKYIGQSINKEYYSIFKFEKPTQRKLALNKIDIEYLINNWGYFSIPNEYYEVFAFMGAFINGHDSIIMKWADFSTKASNNNISKEKVVEQLTSFPVTDRDVQETKKIYGSFLNNHKELTCVWTGNRITEFDIDHIIPFSIWKNNDLWNLLPSDKRTNNKKRDKIPGPKIIYERKDTIITYWNLLHKNNSIRFDNEIKIALLGNKKIDDNWAVTGIKTLSEKCHYLINNRGYEEWNI